MILPFLALFCVGLCAGQGYIRDEPLPRPSIHAWPSSVVPTHGNVTLQCSTPTRGVNFVLRRGRITVASSLSPESPKGLAEFHLTDLQNSHSGEYTCDYYRRKRPNVRSPPSDVLLLLVTGSLPKPSLQAHQRGNVTAGQNVTLQCRQPRHGTESNMFALLKKGTSTPIKIQSLEGQKTDFYLHNVTVCDTGDYSCVYYQTRAPFWASEPSDPLAIWVTDETESSKRKRKTLGTTAIILTVTCTVISLLAAFLIGRNTLSRAALSKMTKSSHSSNKAEDVVTDASPAMKSYSPALDKGSQVSRAGEPYEVMYAELDTKALSEGISSRVKQPLEACVYSALKT
ncbi:T-cell-interacting, activating receptor on myeloid cells protein 1 [Molossus nigricans]